MEGEQGGEADGGAADMEEGEMIGGKGWEERAKRKGSV